MFTKKLRAGLIELYYLCTNRPQVAGLGKEIVEMPTLSVDKTDVIQNYICSSDFIM